MMQRLLIGGAAVVFSVGLAFAATLDGERTYDMLFRNGTLDNIARGSELVYRREVVNTLKPEAGERETGDIALSIEEGEARMALLEFQKDEKHRKLGSFPASVGNPMIMYFYETVVRDMAEAAGGSPYYIRNRVKDALIAPSEIETGEAVLDGRTVETKIITMHPFRDDPNAARMRGFGDLELRVTMSEDVPGWYMAFEALAAEGEVYRSEVSFDRMESAE